MDLIKDILAIVKADSDHDVEIKIDPRGVYIALESDDIYADNDHYIVPIMYSVRGKIVCIDHDKYCAEYKCEEGIGFVYEEICLIERIMDYLRTHREEIDELCNSAGRCRESKNE